MPKTTGNPRIIHPQIFVRVKGKQNQHYHERGNLKNYSRQQRNQIRCLSFYRLEQQLNLVTDYSEIQHISSLLEEARQNLEEAEQRWMELSEKSES